MRLLTDYELDLIAGGYPGGTSSEGNNGGGGGGGGGDTGGGTGYTPPAVETSAAWDQTMANVALFISNVTDSMSRYQTGNYANSDYPDPYPGTAPGNPWMLEMFHYVPNIANDPSFNYYDYLTQDIDPEFMLAAYGPNYFVGNFSAGSAEAYRVDGNSTWITVNGVSVFLTWHQASGIAPPGSNDIIVNGGHWHVGAITNNLVNASVDYDPRLEPPPATPPALTHPAGWDSQRDANIDKLASQLATDINSKADNDKFEYLAFVWKDANGVFHKSTMIKGDTGSVDPFALPPSTFGFERWSQVVAMIHNHPFYKNANPNPTGTPIWVENLTRQYMSVGDFASMKTLVIKEGADSQFRNYVVVDNDVSEYDWVHNSHHTIYGDGGVALVDAVKSDYRPQLGQ